MSRAEIFAKELLQKMTLEEKVTAFTDSCRIQVLQTQR